MSIIKRIIPLSLFLLIVILLWRGLSLHPTEVPSPFINKPAPNLALPNLLDSQKLVTNKDFLGHVTLFNVWATWCEACAEEHAALLDLAREAHVNIIGLDYKDDSLAAKKWLKENGNPYHLVAIDASGTAAIDWGVYGSPETFVIDKKGVIRYKLIGPITSDTWENELQPLLQKLERETT